MNATTNAPCPHGCPWPARECIGRHDRPTAYRAPLPLRVIAVLGFCVLGVNVVLLARLAWDAIRAHLGG